MTLTAAAAAKLLTIITSFHIRRTFSGLPEAEKAARQPRAKFERNLTFAGFLVLVNPLKPDSRSVIRSLQKSSHKTVVITGDSVLTSVDIANQVGRDGDKNDVYFSTPTVGGSVNGLWLGLG